MNNLEDILVRYTLLGLILAAVVAMWTTATPVHAPSPAALMQRVDTPNCFPDWTRGTEGFPMCPDRCVRDI